MENLLQKTVYLLNITNLSLSHLGHDEVQQICSFSSKFTIFSKYVVFSAIERSRKIMKNGNSMPKKLANSCQKITEFARKKLCVH